MTFHLNVLGGLSLTRGGRAVSGAAAQRRNGALLAILAADPRGIPREKVAAILWPESDQEAARNSLKQSVYLLRRELGPDAILGTTELRLGLDVVSCDRAVFEQQLAAGELEEAVDTYQGPFLDGFHLGTDSEEFERWADDERASLARRFRDALEALATAATSRGDQLGAGRWWRRLADFDPLGGPQALGIAASFLARGDRPGALRHAETYRTLLAAELGLAPDAELEKLIATIRVPAPFPKATGPEPVVGPPAIPPAELPSQRTSRRWPAWLGLATTAAIVVAVSAAWWNAPNRAPTPVDPRRVVILVSERTGDGASSSAGFVRLVVETTVRRLNSAAVATPVVLALAAGADGRAAGVQAGAGVVVTVAGVGGQEAFVEAALVNGTTGERLWGLRSVPLAPGSVGLADSLAERIATAVAVHLDSRWRHWVGASSGPVSVEAYQEFSQGLALYADVQPKAAAAHFLAAARDTGFTMALIMTAWSRYYAGQVESADSIARQLQFRLLRPFDRAMVDHQVAVFGHDLPAAYEAAAAVAAAAPASEWRYLLAESAVKVGRAREAARVLEAIGPDLGWLGGFFGYWILLGRSLHALGEHGRELAAMEEARRRFPANRIIAQFLISALSALGRVEDVDAEIDRAFTLQQKGNWAAGQPMDQAIAELLAHGYPDASRRIAERTVAWIGQQPPDERRAFVGVLPYLHVGSGHPREARQAALKLFREDSEDLELIALLARMSAEAGDRATTRQLEARLVARMADPRLRVDILLLRAGIAATLGDRRTAVGFIQDACRAGFEWRSVLHAMPEFRPLLGYQPFEELARSAE